jgi:hypothetical protein
MFAARRANSVLARRRVQLLRLQQPLLRAPQLTMMRMLISREWILVYGSILVYGGTVP